MRTFIAIDLPEKIKSDIAMVSREFGGEGITLVKKEALHLSIRFLGDLTEQGIKKVKDSIDEIDSERFEVRLSGLDYFKPTFLKVIFARVVQGEKECTEIYSQLAGSLVSRGFELEQERYTPHVTIARVRNTRNPAEIVGQIKSHADTEFGSFLVDSIKLKGSELTSEGPIYTDLHKIDL